MAGKDSKSGGSGGGGFIGLVVVTVIALGCGAGFGFFMDGQLKSRSAAGAAPEPEQQQSATPEPNSAVNSPSARLVAMAPIVANLAEPGNVWMRIEASLLIDDTQDGTDALAAQLAEDILAYLKTTTLAQFEGPSGFQNLREDLKDRAAIRDPIRIKDVVIHGVIVE